MTKGDCLFVGFLLGVIFTCIIVLFNISTDTSQKKVTARVVYKPTYDSKYYSFDSTIVIIKVDTMYHVGDIVNLDNKDYKILKD